MCVIVLCENVYKCECHYAKRQNLTQRLGDILDVTFLFTKSVQLLKSTEIEIITQNVRGLQSQSSLA